MFSSENTTKQIQESGVDTAIISFGATEQFGPYLPMNLDNLLAEKYAKHYGDILNAYVLPLIPFNTSEEHSSYIGTVSLSPSVLMMLTEEIVQGLACQGFKKIVIVTGHGGANWISACVKHLNYKYKEMLIVFAHQNSWDSWNEANEKAGLNKRNEVHGGLSSVCTALYLCPENVDLASIKSFGQDISFEMNQFMDYVGWEKITKDGSWGRFELTDEMTPEELQDRGRILWTAFLEKQGKVLKKHLEESYKLKFGRTLE